MPIPKMAKLVNEGDQSKGSAEFSHRSDTVLSSVVRTQILLTQEKKTIL